MISKFEHERLELMENQDKLAKLYQMGVIDSKGDPLPFQEDSNDDMR